MGNIIRSFLSLNFFSHTNLEDPNSSKTNKNSNRVSNSLITLSRPPATPQIKCKSQVKEPRLPLKKLLSLPKKEIECVRPEHFLEGAFHPNIINGRFVLTSKLNKNEEPTSRTSEDEFDNKLQEALCSLPDTRPIPLLQKEELGIYEYFRRPSSCQENIKARQININVLLREDLIQIAKAQLAEGSGILSGKALTEEMKEVLIKEVVKEYHMELKTAIFRNTQHPERQTAAINTMQFKIRDYLLTKVKETSVNKSELID